MTKFHITENEGGFFLHAQDGERGAGVLITSPFLQESLRALLGTLAALEPQKPADDPKDGPCCHEQNEDGLWIGTGCTCQNYGDAQSAALWADAMNRWIEWNNITQNLGEKPMTNATEITARDAALLFRNPSHFDELLSAFEASAEADTASKLDDALKAVARSSLNKTGGKTDG